MLRRCTGVWVIERPVDEDFAAAGLHKPGDHPQAGGLAAAAGPQQRHKLAGFDRQRQAIDRQPLAIMLGQVRQPDRGRFSMQHAQLPKIWLYFSSQRGPARIDIGPVAGEQPHLVHLRFRIGDVFGDVGLEVQPADRRRGQRRLGQPLLHRWLQHAVDERGAEFRFRRALDETQAVDAGEGAFFREHHVDRRARQRCRDRCSWNTRCRRHPPGPARPSSPSPGSRRSSARLASVPPFSSQAASVDVLRFLQRLAGDHAGGRDQHVDALGEFRRDHQVALRKRSSHRSP